MTSRDFIASEATNTDRIILYREGLFWKAYERSAYALCSQVRPLKPTRKVLKALRGGDLISVGFPSASESATLAGLETVERSENRWVVAAPRPIDCEAFGVWKASVPAKVQTVVSTAASAPAGAPVSASASILAGGSVPAGLSAEAVSASAATAPAASASALKNADRPTADATAVTSFGGASAPVRASWFRRMFRTFRSADARSAYEAVVPADDTVRRVIRSIREFDLAEKTPMDCMRFIAELKKTLY